MSVSTPVRTHIRQNVVGYVSLFLVLTGGTAYALDGVNTVFTDDIVNGEVRQDDIRDGAVTTRKIANTGVLTEDLALDAVRGDRVAPGSLTGADLADRSIGGQKIGVETLAGVNVSDGSLFGADIADGAIGAADIGANAVGTGELASGAFEPSDIAPKSLGDPRFGIVPNAIQGDEVTDNALTNVDISESTLDTPEVAFSKADSRVSLPSDNTLLTIAERTVEPGNYLVLGKVSAVSDGGEKASCRLNAIRGTSLSAIDRVEIPTVKLSFGLPGAWGGATMLGLISYSGNIDLSLECGGPGAEIEYARLAALKVNRFIGIDAP